jgi:hypothetical protein
VSFFIAPALGVLVARIYHLSGPVAGGLLLMAMRPAFRSFCWRARATPKSAWEPLA